MDEKIRITFANLGEYDIQVSVIKHWDVKGLNTIGNTIFCISEGITFSMKLDDYNSILRK
jgi:hypothetical protein